MANLHAVTFDCRHAATVARFWAAALDGYEVAPYDDEEVARLAAQGLTPEDDTSVLVEGPAGAPRLWFTVVPEPRGARKNRVHLDVTTGDVPAELARLVSLGASVLAEHDDGHVVLADPEGNELCLFPED